ncbi:MAG: 2-C-methyl-D-erythritol 4-phosphate cytidylyltransferase [Micropruina sp.]|nr:2-C-methyl-D-erythritol 4-phosphate cytidylyltransferase [Micropruina sp.]
MYSLALLNGGVGARVAAGQPKQLIRVNSIPTMVYPLVAADAVPEITEIVLNYPAGWLEDINRVVTDYAIKTPIKYVEAGNSRHESVAKMLPLCSNDRVLLHETARPLVDRHDFAKLIADPHDNVSFMREISFTVAPVDPVARRVVGSLSEIACGTSNCRKNSQVDLVAAHEYAAREGVVFTEDATLCAVANFDVYFIEGSDRNFKITTKTDVRLAGYLLSGDDEDE